MEKETLKVSDWSQPYKLAVYAIAIIGLSLFVGLAVVPWGKEVISLLKTIAYNTTSLTY